MKKHSVIEVEQSIREDLAFVEGQFRVISVDDASKEASMMRMRVGTLYGEHLALAEVPAAIRDQINVGVVLCCTGWPETIGKEAGLFLEVNELLPPEQYTLHHCPTTKLPVFGAQSAVGIAQLLDHEVRNPAVAQAVHALLSQYKIFKPFFTKPASVEAHHAEPGGLAAHSLEVGRLVAAIPSQYFGKPINRDVSIAAALLHDLGKIHQYRVAGEPYRMSHIKHQDRTLCLIAPMIEWLEQHEDISVAELLFSLLTIDGSSEHASSVAAIALTQADRMSATHDAARIAFSGLPNHCRHAIRGLGGGSTKKYIRAVEQYREPPYVKSIALDGGETLSADDAT